MKTINISLPVNLAIMLRDAAIWFSDEQRARRAKLAPDVLKKIGEVAEFFDKIRYDAAERLDQEIKGKGEYTVQTRVVDHESGIKGGWHSIKEPTWDRLDLAIFEAGSHSRTKCDTESLDVRVVNRAGRVQFYYDAYRNEARDLMGNVIS